MLDVYSFVHFEVLDFMFKVFDLDGILVLYAGHRWFDYGCMEIEQLRLIEMVCEALWRLRRRTWFKRGEVTRVVHARTAET